MAVVPGIGALTLSSNSTIDFAPGEAILAYGDSNSRTWTGLLKPNSWSGTFDTRDGADQLYFGTNSSSLAPQPNQITFYSDSGTTYLDSAAYAGMDGELAPVPEPATWFAGSLAFGGLAFSQRRRLLKFLPARR